MITLTGKKVSEGIVIGKLVFYKRDERENRRIYVKDVEKEVQRFQKARQKAMAELKELYVTSIREVGEANAAIFEMQQKILEEEEFVDRVVNIVVEEKLNAEYAVQATAEEILKGVEGEGKEYLQGHSADVKDVALRLLQILSRSWKDRLLTDEPFVLATSELYPSEAVQLDKSKVLGFVTRYGTINSHTAVIARTKNIPSVIGLGEALKKDYDGKTIIIDGFEGKVYIEPDQTTLAKMKQRKSENRTQIQNLERLKGKENITQSGQKIEGIVCRLEFFERVSLVVVDVQPFFGPDQKFPFRVQKQCIDERRAQGREVVRVIPVYVEPVSVISVQPFRCPYPDESVPVFFYGQYHVVGKPRIHRNISEMQSVDFCLRCHDCHGHQDARDNDFPYRFSENICQFHNRIQS